MSVILPDRIDKLTGVGGRNDLSPKLNGAFLLSPAVIATPDDTINLFVTVLAYIGSPEVSEGILDRKLTCIDETGITTVVTGNPGCILHMRGGAHASGRDLQILHIAEYLAARLPSDS